MSSTSALALPALQSGNGLFTTMPKLFLVDTGPESEVRIATMGTPPNNNYEWSQLGFAPVGAFYPNYSSSALRAGVAAALVGGTPSQLPALRLGSFSTGYDVMPAAQRVERPTQGDTIGLLNAPGNRWWYVSATVAGLAMPTLADPVWQGLGSPSGSVVTYYLDGNQGVADQHVGTLLVEHTPNHWNLGSIGGGDLQGLDLGGGIVTYDPSGTRGTLFIDERRYIYFTLKRSWVDALLTQFPAARFEVRDAASMTTATTLEVPDPAAVYRLKWIDLGGGTYGWSELSLAFTREELFDDALLGDPQLEIDGLSVDWLFPEVGSRVPQVIFSAAITSHPVNPSQPSTPNELMIYAKDGTFNTNGDSQAYAAYVTETNPPGGETALSAKLGLGPNGAPPSMERNGVNGICSGDPEKGVYSRMIGTPRDPSTPIIRPTLNLSVTRGNSFEPGLASTGGGPSSGSSFGTPGETLHFACTGLPIRTANDPPAIVFIQIGSVPYTSSGSDPVDPIDWLLLGYVAYPVGGSEAWLDVPDPPITGSGAALVFRAVVIEFPTGANPRLLAQSSNGMLLPD